MSEPITSNLSAGHAKPGHEAGSGTHEAMQNLGTPNGAGAGTHAAMQAIGTPNGPGAGTHAAAQGV